MKSQPAITIGTSRMNLELTTTISGTMTAAAIATMASASSWCRRIRRSRPSYCSTGICCVFHERPHVSQRQRSP